MSLPLILTDGSGNNSFSATGDGTSFNVQGACPGGVSYLGILKNFTVTTTLTGSPTGVSVKLQGSIDDSLWADLGNTTSTSNDMFHVADKPVLYIRGSVATLSGGSSPTITIKVIASA